MNGWTQEELDRLEKRAAELKSISAMQNYLHIATGLSYAVCEAWANEIKQKSECKHRE